MRNRPSRRPGQAGFSMTEVMIAAIVATIILMAVAAALTAGISANRTIKGNEQATGLANKEIEGARNRPFDELVMDTSTLVTGDPNGLVNSGGTWQFPPSPGAALEPVEHAAGGPIKRETIVNDPVLGVQFTVRTYIARIDTGSVTFGAVSNRTRRITTVVSYRQGGATFSAKSSTIITRSRRGLPEPKFEITPFSQTLPAVKGVDLVFAHTIRNLGVTDTYDIEAPVAGRPSWNGKFRIYADSNGSGLYEPGTDTPILDPLGPPAVLSDTNGNGLADTGSVATDRTTTFFAVFSVPLLEPDGAVPVSIKVISGAHDTVFQTIANTAQVTPYQWDRYFPYNQEDIATQQGDSPLVGLTSSPVYPFPMAMDPNAPDEFDALGNQILWDDLAAYGVGQTPAGPGRPIWPAGTVPAFNATLGSATAPNVAAWTTQVSAIGAATPTFGPWAYLQIYVANHNSVPCDTPIPLKIYLNRTTTETGSPTAIASASFVLPMTAVGVHAGGCRFAGYGMYVPIPTTTIPSGNWLQLRLELDTNAVVPARTAPALLSYGVDHDVKPQLGIASFTALYVMRQS